MKKLILSLGVIAALSAPAFAQSTGSAYDNSAGNVAAGGNSGVAQPNDPNNFVDKSRDTTTTGSIGGSATDSAVKPVDPSMLEQETIPQEDRINSTDNGAQ